MANKEVIEGIKELAAANPDIDLKSADFEDGQLTLRLGVNNAEQIAELPPGIEIESAGNMMGSVTPMREYGTSIIRRPPLDRGYLDLDKGSILEQTPQELYQRAINYWRCKPVYGTTINNLTNFASKGFENDIDDVTIKNFYDNWIIDTNFTDIVNKIFFCFFREGFVRTYKVLGPYEPKTNFLSSLPGQKNKPVKAGMETDQAKKRFSKAFIPISYTILNPTFVKIKGSLMFGQTNTFLEAKAGDEMRDLLKLPKNKLTKFQKNILKHLEAPFKRAVIANEDIPLNPERVGEVDYRRMPYERYPIPRGARGFDALEFKNDLRQADSSTLDGITNYILKITVGSDKHPVRKQEVLEAAASMFDTVSKSFKVVWDHTLKVEKITVDNIGDILGKDKYIQTNEDITAAIGFPRALIDGISDSNPAALELAVKSVIEEINYARQQVTQWIYKEYRAVAESMGFSQFPSVRFDDQALRDELAMMAIVQGMIDRRIISYRTGQKKLGFDPDTELMEMKKERPLVEKGILGIQGSPFQQSKQQQTPSGTPSEGRPKGKPAKSPDDSDKTKPPTAPKKKQVVDNTARAALEAAAAEMSLDDLVDLLERVKANREKVEGG